VPILASDDAKNRIAEKNHRLRVACDARMRARTKTKIDETLEPAPALGFKAFRIFRLAVQSD
jgi:hypothetical protein